MPYTLTGVSNGSKQSLASVDSTENTFYLALDYPGQDSLRKYGVLTFEPYAPNSSYQCQMARSELWFRGGCIFVPQFPTGYVGAEIVAYWIYQDIPYILEIYP